jgi:hypothetical protein
MGNTSVKWLCHILNKEKDKEVDIPKEYAQVNEYDRLIQTAKEKTEKPGKMETEKPSKRYQSTKLHSIAAQKPVTSD